MSTKPKQDGWAAQILKRENGQKKQSKANGHTKPKKSNWAQAKKEGKLIHKAKIEKWGTRPKQIIHWAQYQNKAMVTKLKQNNLAQNKSKATGHKTKAKQLGPNKSKGTVLKTKAKHHGTKQKQVN